MKRSNLIILGVIATVFMYFTAVQFRARTYVKGGVIDEVGAEVSIMRDISAFKSIAIYSTVQVYFKQDSISKIRLVGPENFLPFIKTKVKQSELVIEKEKRMDNQDTIKIYISNPVLDSVRVDYGASFHTLGKVQGEQLKLDFNDSSTGDLELSYKIVTCSFQVKTTVSLKGDSGEIRFSN